MKIKEIAICACAIACLTISSWISIPMVVPFTLQTFALFAIILLLKGRLATISVLGYLLLGAVGFPVFAQLHGGLIFLFGLTGGYLFGFLFVCLWMWGSERYWQDHKKRYYLCACIGMLICYGIGSLWFYFTAQQSDMRILYILQLCVIPYIIPDALKIIASYIVYERIALRKK